MPKRQRRGAENSCWGGGGAGPAVLRWYLSFVLKGVRQAASGEECSRQGRRNLKVLSTSVPGCLRDRKEAGVVGAESDGGSARREARLTEERGQWDGPFHGFLFRMKWEITGRF